MQRLLVLLLILTACKTVAQPRYTYKVESAGHDVWLLNPQLSDRRWVTSNIILIVNEKNAIVVDTGLLPSAADAAIVEIAKLTNKPIRYIINTHWHGDHWQGNESFRKKYPDAEIISSVKGFESINRNGVIWARTFYARYFKNMVRDYKKDDSTKTSDGKPLTIKEQELLKADIDAVQKDIDEMGKLQPVFPTITFENQMILREGKREIQLHYLGIGNTIGDIVVYLPGDEMLITGDLVVFPSPYESGAFSSEWINTTKRLKEFRFTKLLPGHGEIQQGSQYLDYLIALFDELKKQMDAAYKSGVSNIDDAKKAVTHETVTTALLKDGRYMEYINNLDPAFVPAAINTVYRRIIEGKL